MSKFCLSIEPKVECNQKMKLPQGLNNLHGRINHPAELKRRLKLKSITKELFQPRHGHLRAWPRGEEFTHKLKGLAIQNPL